MELLEIKTLIEKTGKSFEEFKNSVNTQVAELKAGRSDPLLTEKIEKMGKSIADMSMDKDNAERALKASEERISKMEADFKISPRGNGASEDAYKTAKEAYSKSIQSFIRKGREDADINSKAMEAYPELKALSVGHDPDGGYLVSPDHSSQIITQLYETSPMRQVCTVESISSDALDIMEDINDMAGGWSGEVASRAETDTAEIGMRRISVHELSAMPKASQKILDDAVINIESWLATKQADKFSRLENTAFVTGTGVGQPRGFTTYGAGTTNPGQIERVTTATNDVLDDVDLVDLLYSLKAEYRKNATWAFNRNSMAVISKIQDGQGRFVFQPGLQLGAPSGLLGRPIVEFNDMANVGDGTLPVAIADWKSAYTVVDRKGITILRDPYTSKPHVLFYTLKRTGGDVTNFEAIKMIVVQ
jgi:HK97 family phage major capsid protein